MTSRRRCWSSTTSACRPASSAAPISTSCLPARSIPRSTPYFAEIHQLRVSAHCLIRRDGEIVQYVPFDQRAWHAGVSLYQGRDRCNDFSIGIELEGTDQLPYTEAQYRALQAVTALLAEHYPPLAANIAGIAISPPAARDRSRAGVRLGSLSGISGTTRRARRRYA